MENPFPKFFLGANSCEGFVSRFADCYSATDGWHALLIKGGPGTGKSSLMKYIASQAEQAGTAVELCPCSSDPHSLDGVILPQKKTVLLDATAPHIVEPSLPGACEEILDLGIFWDRSRLVAHADEIRTATAKNKQLHQVVSRYLSAAGELFADDLRLARSSLRTDRIAAFAETLCRRYLPRKKGQKGREQVRFLQGVTPMGLVCYSGTVTDFYPNRVVIEDRLGAASTAILQSVRDYALRAGYDIITLRNPFLPSEKIDHLLIPSLSLAFVTENEFVHFSCDDRRIHARRFTDAATLRHFHGRLQFNRRIRRELLLSACETLARAKDVHDDLEAYYKDAMDFEALTRFARDTSKKLLAR